jgi:hypothetical protein
MSIKNYEKIESSDICVGLCFFRPVDNYKNIIENIKIVLEDLDKSCVPFFVIELLYKNQTSIIPNSKIVYSNSVIFSKENLWNILEKQIPEKYSKIIFMDADVRFTNCKWIDLVSQKLNQNQVMQPMEYSYRQNKKSNLYFIDSEKLKPSCAKAIVIGDSLSNFKNYHPGYSICINRNFYHSIGGIFEDCITGAGDSLFWSCFFEKEDYKFIKETNNKDKFLEYRKKLRSFIDKDCVGYLENNILFHMYHGSEENRRYNQRKKYLPENYKIFKNEYGVLEIESEKDFLNYFVDRKEDD